MEYLLWSCSSVLIYKHRSSAGLYVKQTSTDFFPLANVFIAAINFGPCYYMLPYLIILRHWSPQRLPVFFTLWWLLQIPQPKSEPFLSQSSSVGFWTKQGGGDRCMEAWRRGCSWLPSSFPPSLSLKLSRYPPQLSIRLNVYTCMLCSTVPTRTGKRSLTSHNTMPSPCLISMCQSSQLRPLAHWAWCKWAQIEEWQWEGVRRLPSAAILFLNNSVYHRDSAGHLCPRSILYTNRISIIDGILINMKQYNNGSNNSTMSHFLKVIFLNLSPTRFNHLLSHCV